MKHQKQTFLLISALLIFCMSCSLHAEDVKKADTEKSLYKLKLLWSREFPDKPNYIRLAADGVRCGVRTVKGKGKDRIFKFHMLDNKGKDIWTKMINGILYPEFSGNNDILLGFYLFGKQGDADGFSYFDINGKELWQEYTDVDEFLMSPGGKYIGLSGILNTYEQSCMDWWELRDKDFNLLWKYTPKHNIDAIVLGDGKTLMVEGREVKLFGKGGQEIKKIIIPDIEPHSIAYQGCVNPTTRSGPLYLKGTKDGKYAVFCYRQKSLDSDNYWTTVYSVDMEKGTWWSYVVDKEYKPINAALNNDGRYFLLYKTYEALLFDNRTGKLLWKDRTSRGHRQLERARIITVDESIFVVLNWSTRSKDSDQIKREWMYVNDIKGNRIKFLDDLIFDIYNCKQVEKYIVEIKNNRVNKYLIELRKN